MRVGNGAGQGVGGVGSRFAGQREQATHHMLHLRLGRVAVADHGLLDLQRRVFGDLDAFGDEGRDGGAPGLSEQQGRLRIDVDENDLDHGLAWGVTGDEFADSGVDRPQSGGQAGFGVSADATAGDVAQSLAADVDDAKAGAAQPGIDAQDARRRVARGERGAGGGRHGVQGWGEGVVYRVSAFAVIALPDYLGLMVGES